MKKRMFSGAEAAIFERVKALRKDQTGAEEILWTYLRTRPFGFKFRRQHPFSNYILDFYCHSFKLAIEVDGSIYNKEKVKQNDTIRQLQMEQAGVNFIRFTNDEIKLKREHVICQIETYLKENIEKCKHSPT